MVRFLVVILESARRIAPLLDDWAAIIPIAAS